MALILSENEIHNHGGMRTAWIYNSLDASITAEVADTMLPLVEADPNAQLFYDFSLAQQQAAFAMAMRGVAVDPEARKLAIKWQEGQKTEALARLAEVVAPHWNNQPDELMPRAPLGRCHDNKLHKWGENGGPCSICGLTRTVQRPFNPEGAAQTMRLLYTYLGLREQLDHKTHKPTSGAKALESLLRNPVLKKGGRSEEAIPVLQAILDERRAQTQLEKLNAPLDHDNRWRCSWNVGGTKTGRWSSSASAFWTGGNLQNIANRARGMFVADPGLVLVYADYKQAESNVCAYDAEDEAYIEAHRSGDVHTDVCRLVWPDAYDWPEDIREARKLADNPASWDAHHPLRWYGKHIAHGSAIGMTPVGIARDAHVKQALAEQAQKAFFRKFSRLQARQREIWSEIQQTGELINPLGRRHPFLGRLVGDGADATRREALAQTQSSMVADWVGIALCRIFHELDGGVRMWQSPSPSHLNRVWLLGQIHDALLFEVRAGDDEAIARVQQLMTFGMMFRGREFRLGVDFHVGKSWRETPEGEAALPTDMTRWVPGMDWSSLR